MADREKRRSYEEEMGRDEDREVEEEEKAEEKVYKQGKGRWRKDKSECKVAEERRKLDERMKMIKGPKIKEGGKGRKIKAKDEEYKEKRRWVWDNEDSGRAEEKKIN